MIIIDIHTRFPTGFIGPEYSSEVEAILPILGAVDDELKLPLVGFSTTAENLRNAGNQFPNFFRVVPSDQLQVEVSCISMNTRTALQENKPKRTYERC